MWPLVPTVASFPQPEEERETQLSGADKDTLCPICMEVIKDAFLTACGHSFCYSCISTHLRNKKNCPSCAHYLTTSHIFPNFLLNKLVKKTSAHRKEKNVSAFEHLRQALQKGCDVSVKDLDGLLSLLAEKKRNLEKAEAETNKHVLLDFLHCLRKKKIEELRQLQADLQFINEDIHSIERHRNELQKKKEKYSVKLGMLSDDFTGRQAQRLLIGKHSNVIITGAHGLQGQISAESLQHRKADLAGEMSRQRFQRKDILSRTEEDYITQHGLAVARKRRICSQFNELQECYLQKRRYWATQSQKYEESDTNPVDRESYNPGLEAFQSVLSTFTRYSRMRVIAEISNDDLFHSANIVSSIEFDRDDEFFATAGVSRRIKVYEFSSVINEPAEVHCPVAAMSTRSKLSCLSWNKYMKNHIASSDYEGIVTVWDVTTRQSVMEYEEHERRVWSVDFSHVEPSMLVSGSDDCKVKIWCTKQETSVMNIDMKANICSVKCNPSTSTCIAVGSADHQIHYYDLRNTSQALHVFSGHRKAVSYVQFLSDHELISASTDSTLRLWDVKENIALRTFRGHTNEKNFVGLTVNSAYIACGSETNEVFVYHKAISKPMAQHTFGSTNMDDTGDAAGSYFTSAVCWKSDNPTILAANSQGTIKVLVLGA